MLISTDWAEKEKNNLNRIRSEEKKEPDLTVAKVTDEYKWVSGVHSDSAIC